MTELKQEAEEYVCKRNPLVTKEWFIDAFKKYDKGEKVKYLKDYEIVEYEAYLAGSEPREKRIAELEAENKQIKNSDTLCKLIGEQKIKIAELEAQIEKMKCCRSCKHDNHCNHRVCDKSLPFWELRR